MQIQPIKTESDYQAALSEIEGLMSAQANSSEGDRLDVLVTLVEAYERTHYPIDFPDPIEAIKFRMEQQGLSVEGLHETFSIPAESLLKHSAKQDNHVA